MIQKLQKIFHTDKWWGKIIFMMLFYLLLWFIFYLVLFFISWIISEFVLGGFVFVYLITVIILSIILPTRFFNKVIGIKKLYLYLISILFTIISLFLLFLFVLTNLRLNIGGF